MNKSFGKLLIIILFLPVLSVRAAYLPELEIDENENSRKIFESLFELISVEWTGAKVENFIRKRDESHQELKLEFRKKLNRAKTRLLELKHLIDCQPKSAPYFTSFYFRQIMDMDVSFEKISDVLKERRFILENRLAELENSLLMVKELDMGVPELRWQKKWIIFRIEPLLVFLKKTDLDLSKMIKEAEGFQDKLDAFFRAEEKKVEENYRNFYSHRFNFILNSQGSGAIYELKRVFSDLLSWQYSLSLMLPVVLPDYGFLPEMIACLLICAFFSALLYIYCIKVNKGIRSFLRPWILFSIGLFFTFGIVILPSTSDIMVFTFAGIFISLGLLDFAWKLRSTWAPLNGINPFLCIIPAWALTDFMISLLIPVNVLLMTILLISVLEIILIVSFFSIYEYPLTEKIMGGVIPFFLWLATGIAALNGYLYPSMLIAIPGSFLLCILYSGSVFTHFFMELAGRLSERRLIAAFMLTLLIPLIWLAMILGGLCWAGQIFNAARILEIVFDADLLPSVSISISPRMILEIIMFGLFIKFALSWMHHMLEVFSDARKMDTASVNSAFLIVKYLTWCVFIIFVLDSLHIDWNAIKWVIGGFSVGFGFALKDLLENFVCGIILLIGKEVRIGDIIEFGNEIGTIEKINIRATFIKTLDNAIITLPNTHVVSKDFRNLTLNSGCIRREVDVSVAYGSDVQKIAALLKEAARSCDMVYGSIEPEVLLQNFDDSALTFRLRFWIHARNVTKAPSLVRMKIDELFRANGIVIPFRQIDVHWDNKNSGQMPIAPSHTHTDGCGAGEKSTSL